MPRRDEVLPPTFVELEELLLLPPETAVLRLDVVPWRKFDAEPLLLPVELLLVELLPVDTLEPPLVGTSTRVEVLPPGLLLLEPMLIVLLPPTVVLLP